MAGRHASRSGEGPRIAGHTTIRSTPAALEHWIKVRVKAREAGDAGDLCKLGKLGKLSKGLKKYKSKVGATTLVSRI